MPHTLTLHTNKSVTLVHDMCYSVRKITIYEVATEFKIYGTQDTNLFQDSKITEGLAKFSL
jgi:hypothetical protein